MDLKKIKKEIIKKCEEDLLLKISGLNTEIAGIKNDQSGEAKSSMGDKYETSRELMAQERGKLENQKSVMEKNLSFMRSIDSGKEFRKVEFGALIDTGKMIYLIGAAVGLVQGSGWKAYVISANSPIAQSLLGKRESEEVVFNHQEIKILTIA